MVLLGAARVFGGAAPATGEPAELFLRDGALEVRSASVAATTAISDLRVREVGGGPVGLEFGWQSKRGAIAVHVFDTDVLRAIDAQPALGAAAQLLTLRSARRRRRIGRTLGWSAVVALLAAPLLVLLVFIWQADRLAGALAERVSIEQETALGERAFTSLRPGLELQEEGSAHALVQQLGARLSADSRYRYRFYVARDDAVNAFALPGGVIVIHTGLIEATRRPEELAGVMAHEIQHVEQRHSLESLFKHLGLRGVWLLATGDLGSGVLGQAAVEITSLTFSRDAEHEADALGFEALVEVGVDPSGMADFFSVLTSREGGAPPAWLSTHPTSVDRERALRARLRALGGRTFAPLPVEQWPP